MIESMSQLSITRFWERFDETRKVTIEVLCRETGISTNTLRGLKSHNKLPNLADTVVIADYLDVSLDWLVLGKVCQENDTDINEVLKAFLGSDNITRLLVKRALKII